LIIQVNQTQAIPALVTPSPNHWLFVVLDYYNLEIVENSGVAAIANKCA